MTEKISSDEIKRDADAGKGLGKNPSAKFLFHLLAAVRGHGDRATTLKGIANEVYVNAPTQNNKVSMKPRREADTRTKGDIRLAKLARGSGSFTPREAEMFHTAFENAFGAEWGNLISPKELVLGDARQILRKAIAQGLPWPDNLSSLKVLEILALADEEISPALSIVPTGRFNIMSSSNRENADLFPINEPQTLSPDDRIFLQASNIDSKFKAFFVFVAVDTSMGSKQSNASYEILPFSVRNAPKASSCMLGPTQGDCFVVEPATGLYGLGIVCATERNALEAIFPKSSNPSRWTVQESKAFLHSLRQLRQNNTSQTGVSVVPYRVS